jgi:hypothetical protein
MTERNHRWTQMHADGEEGRNFTAEAQRPSGKKRGTWVSGTVLPPPELSFFNPCPSVSICGLLRGVFGG